MLFLLLGRANRVAALAQHLRGPGQEFEFGFRNPFRLAAEWSVCSCSGAHPLAGVQFRLHECVREGGCAALRLPDPGPSPR